MSQITVTNLTFCYDGSYSPLFENLNLQLDTDWKLGFIGRNGRGKTTFLKLLQKQLEYRGNISSPVKFDYFPFEIATPTRPVRGIIADFLPEIMVWQVERELSLLGLPNNLLDRSFQTLSNGEQTKVQLAMLFLKDNNFLLIDEPTNHLDLEARDVVSAYLNTKKGYIIVSHDRSFLDHCIDHVLSINKANIDIQKGNFSTWWQNKLDQDRNEIATNEKLNRDIKRLSVAAKRTSDWSDEIEKTKIGGNPKGGMVDRGYIGHQAAKMMQRAKAIQNRQQRVIEEKAQRLQNIDSAHALKIHPLIYHADRLVSLKNVSIYYGEHQACSAVDFEIHVGDRIALRGANGSGKSSILKLIIDESIGTLADSGMTYLGNCQIGSQLIISYVPQDAAFLTGSVKGFIADRGIDESLFKAILNKLNLTKELFDHDLSTYSGGQKKKVLIAASLCERAHLYIWDEPLNYIDVISRIQIEDLLAAFKPTLLFVEHDREFCDHVATQVIAR
ncbi:MAG: ABC-F type ribosomal protection protein [Eubacteriales bacterium]|nr:ABC-F type ribosomal protection protein [Eubacteriales bacterium]